MAKSVKLAGKVARSLAREIEIWWSSSGCRRASSTDLGNSGNSSRKRMPRCASEISPGVMGFPPPMIEQAELLW